MWIELVLQIILKIGYLPDTVKLKKLMLKWRHYFTVLIVGLYLKIKIDWLQNLIWISLEFMTVKMIFHSFQKVNILHLCIIVKGKSDVTTGSVVFCLSDVIKLYWEWGKYLLLCFIGALSLFHLKMLFAAIMF